MFPQFDERRKAFRTVLFRPERGWDSRACIRQRELLRQSFWLRTFVNKLEGLLLEYLSGAFSKTGARDVSISFEAVEVLFGEDIAERVVCQPEQQIVLPAHFALQIIANVRQRFAGYG